MSIDLTLHKELTSLYNECNNLIRELEEKYAYKLVSLEFINSETNEKINILELLKQICCQLEIHLKLDDTTITSVDFYSNFQSQFDLGRYQKGVDYYIQDGYGGKEELVTDPDVLKKEFTINNCMNSMNLVPINLASNAMKYMPCGQQTKVVLLKTPRRNIITITNLGAKNHEDNLEKLTEEGYRGNNSSTMAGMGLGLSQIKSIVGLHKTLLDASIDIAQDNNTTIKIGEDDYTWFSVTITYLRSLSDQVITPSTTDFFNRIPLIIAHNMVDILANLFVVIDKLPKLRFIEFDKSLRNKYVGMINNFQLNVERMQEIIKLCLYVRNNYSTKYLLGNKCPIAIGSFFKREMEQLYTHKYCHLQKPEIRGESQKIDVYSAVYPALYGLCELILDGSNSETELDIEIDDISINIVGNSIDFDEIIYDGDLNDDPEQEYLQHIKSYMCMDILEECGIEIEISNKELIINYQNV